CDSSTARTTRIAYDSPSKNFCTPATMAAAAERCPPPVSDEMIRIFGIRCCCWDILVEIGYRQARVFCLLHCLARLLHLALQFLDLDQVTGIERKRRLITIRLVPVEAAIE